MAKLSSNGYFFCSRCERDELTRADFYVDNSKKHGLSNLCKLCESERTRKPKHDHYMRSERHQQSLRRQSKRRYYLKNREEIMIKSRAYKRREPGKIRGYLLKRKYQLSSEERAEMIDEQQGMCEICGEFQGDALCVDHDHVTGRVRAMLCRHCNTGLGFFHDDPALLQIAIVYLRAYSIDTDE
jgi:recombination endonuclease VII